MTAAAWKQHRAFFMCFSEFVPFWRALNSRFPPLKPSYGRFQAIMRIFVPFSIKSNSTKIFEKGTNFSKMIKNARKASSEPSNLTGKCIFRGTEIVKPPENAQPEARGMVDCGSQQFQRFRSFTPGVQPLDCCESQ